MDRERERGREGEREKVELWRTLAYPIKIMLTPRQDCIIDKLDLEQGRMSVALPEEPLNVAYLVVS